MFSIPNDSDLEQTRLIRSEPNFDAVIVGAGPAGSAAAITLARAGRSVLVIEKQRFPRAKVCGGCLSGAAVSRLRELLGEQETPGVPGSSITLVVGNHRITCQTRGATWLASRAELDAFLADAASAAGATIRYGQPAMLARDNGEWAVVVGDERIRARAILIASGLTGLPRQLGIPPSCSGQPMIGQQWIQAAHPSLPPLGCVELHWLRGGYVGFATSHADRCNVALAVKADAVAGCGALEGLRRLNPRAALWNMLPPDATPPYGSKGVAGFPWVPRRLGTENVLLIGDAAGYAEPFTGEGIGQAMTSAQCAAHAIVAGGDVLGTYAAMMRWRRALLWRTRMLGAILNAASTRFSSYKRSGFLERVLLRSINSVHVGSAS